MVDVVRHAALAEPISVGPLGSRKLRHSIARKDSYQGRLPVGREANPADLPEDPLPLHIL